MQRAACMIGLSLLLTLPGCGRQNRGLRIWPITEATPPESARPEPAPQTSPRPAVANLTAPGGVRSLGQHPDETGARPTSLLTNVRQHTFSSVGRDFDPDMHPDGRMVVFASTRNAETADLFYKDVNGFTITQLTSDLGDDVQPRLSPTGDQVVFASNRTGNWDLWRINLDGTGLMQLTRHPGDEMGPTWSPDGRQVAFTVWGARSKQWELWVLDVENPGVRKFLTYGMFPDWSPDGRSIAFQRARRRGTRWFSVWRVDLVDGEARHPTEVAYSDSAACTVPRWSPDGTALVYCAVRDTSVGAGRPAPDQVAAEVWRVDARSGVRTRIVHAGTAAFNPIWAPDGRIFFVSAQAGTENIWSSNQNMTPTAAGVPQLAPPMQTASAGMTPSTSSQRPRATPLPASPSTSTPAPRPAPVPTQPPAPPIQTPRIDPRPGSTPPPADPTARPAPAGPSAPRGSAPADQVAPTGPVGVNQPATAGSRPVPPGPAGP